MFWLHFSARFGRKGAHVLPTSALVSPLHGSWAPLVAVVTRLCAAGPYRWSMGDPAHTATYRVNVRMKGPRHPPIRRSRLSGCRALMSATHGVAGPHDPYCIDIPEQKGPQIREAPTLLSGRSRRRANQTPELFRPSSRARGESSGTVPAWLPALTMRLEPSTKTTAGVTWRTRDSGTWA